MEIFVKFNQKENLFRRSWKILNLYDLDEKKKIILALIILKEVNLKVLSQWMSTKHIKKARKYL